LRRHKVAFVLIDHPWMTPADQLLSRLDPVTADFSYIRWLGDRKGIEEKTKKWDRLIMDRERDMDAWVNVIQKLLARTIPIYAYFNNHYAGYAPGSITRLLDAWRRKAG